MKLPGDGHDHQDLSRALWHASTTEANTAAPPLTGAVRTDVAIVGAGYTGLSAALHLAERGVNVRVLEAKEPGWGASGRNGGQVIAGLKYEPEYLEQHFGDAGARMAELSGSAPDFLFSLVRRFEIQCDAAASGWIQPATNSKNLATVTARAKAWEKRGVKVTRLDKQQIGELIGTDFYVGGWIDPRGGSVQPLSLARGLARAAIQKGAQVHGHSPVTNLMRDGKQWRLTTQNGGIVVADTVFLCTNAYTTNELWKGLAQSIIPVRAFQVATAPLSDNVRRTVFSHGYLASSDAKRMLTYTRVDRDGRVVMGGRGAFDHKPHSEIFGKLRADVQTRFFPQVGEPRWDYAWSGWIAMTADHLPHLNELAPGLYAGLGYNGRGVALACVMGKQLADRATEANAGKTGWPAAEMKTLPFHAFRQPALRTIRSWWRFRDNLDKRLYG
ncbi:MAG: FAD-dependent oxidoreductase [Alphaproteobacteria bacterium]|nr:FAD-dependent oxidoreductase [Alphaproteobacteria bacterium]